MRTGRVVQSGTVDEVWRTPVDAEAARFLGYATVLEGEAARRVLVAAGSPQSGGPLALRRSALRVAADGDLHGRVVEARMTPDVVRLEVEVDGVGRLPAVAPLPDRSRDAGGLTLGLGDVVRLVVDPTRTAPLGPPLAPPLVGRTTP
jgi:thiamine transport system ATP-binding protein